MSAFRSASERQPLGYTVKNNQPCPGRDGESYPAAWQPYPTPAGRHCAAHMPPCNIGHRRVSPSCKLLQGRTRTHRVEDKIADTDGCEGAHGEGDGVVATYQAMRPSIIILIGARAGAQRMEPSEEVDRTVGGEGGFGVFRTALGCVLNAGIRLLQRVALPVSPCRSRQQRKDRVGKAEPAHRVGAGGAVG